MHHAISTLVCVWPLGDGQAKVLLQKTIKFFSLI